jgi:hypothetical protein
MSRDLRPLAECLQDLRKLAGNGASGNFYLAGADNQISAITLNNGVIEAVNFQGRRGDLAVELLKGLDVASCSFRAEPGRSPKYSQLSATAVRWLTGGSQDPAPPKAAPPSGRAEIDRHRKTIESVAFAFLGPIAGAICESVFADCGTVQQVVHELAANLPPDEAGRFRSEIEKATGIRRT